MDRIDFLRHEVPPIGSLLYVLYAGTTTLVPIFADKDKITPIVQPIVINTNSVHFYADNTRVDMKIVHTSYPGGFIVIEDQILFDWQDLGIGTIPLETDYEITTNNIDEVVIGATEASGLVEVFLNGVRLRNGLGRDYVLTGTTLEFQGGWKLFKDDIVTVLYMTA